MRQAGAFVFAIVSGRMQQPGLPDRCVMHKGDIFFLEFKLDNGKVDRLQAHVHAVINKHVPKTAFVIWFSADEKTVIVEEYEHKNGWEADNDGLDLLEQLHNIKKWEKENG
jgi:hypothetical protein